MKSTIPASDEIWSLIKETQANLEEVSVSQKETNRQIQKIGGRFNQRWGALVESVS